MQPSRRAPSAAGSSSNWPASPAPPSQSAAAWPARSPRAAETTTTTTAAAAATTTAAGGGTTTTAPAVPTPPPARRPRGASQVIKIGNLTDFAIPPLVNTRKALEAVVEGVNADGGWKVGDTTYTLELISYDTKSDPNTARSAVERLISQDKVNVIFGDQTASNWATETEAAKVLALVGTPLTDVYKPEYKYTFVTSKLPTEAPVRLG